MTTKAGMFFTTIREDYLNNADGSDSNAFGVPPNDLLLPMSFACPKAAEGSRWWSTPEGFAAMRDAYQGQGIGVLPWMIPRGRSLEEAFDEGAAAAKTLAILGGFQQIDLENGHADPYYWVGGDAEVEAFGRGIEATGFGGEYVLLPDSRPDKLEPTRFWTWYRQPWISRRVHPQAYASIFYTNPNGRQKRGIDIATVALLDGGVQPADIFPVLSTTDNNATNPISGGELVEGINYCHERGFSGFFIWRRGLFTPEQRDAMLALPDPWAPVTPPEPPQPPPADEWAAALARLEASSIAQRSATEDVIRLAGQK